jgi:hypothetical protein
MSHKSRRESHCSRVGFQSDHQRMLSHYIEPSNEEFIMSMVIGTDDENDVGDDDVEFRSQLDTLKIKDLVRDMQTAT